MSFQDQTEEALHLAGDREYEYRVEDFYPATFPDDVPIIKLEKVSLSKLVNGNSAEARRVFDIYTTTGFFYLDMLDHPTGRQLWRTICRVCCRSHERFINTPMEEKLKYKPLDGVRVFDRGFVGRLVISGG